MTNGEKALRLGIYAGLAAVKLGDPSFAEELSGRNICDVTDEDFRLIAGEIHVRLLIAGFIQPDEDPFEAAVQDLVEQMGEEQVRWMLNS